MADVSWLTWLTIGFLAVVTVVTRCFFFFSESDWVLPRWAERGLQYAPIAALAAVVIPAVLADQGQLIDTWKDARWVSAVAGAIWFFWRGGVLGTIVTGMAVYLPLRLWWGW